MMKNNQKIPEGWSVTFLENLTKHVKYGVVDGPFGSNLKSEHYRLMGIPVIQSGFVTSQKFMANNYLYVDEALFEREKRSATHAEDIIMAKIGAQAGTCALLPKGHPEAILAGNCLKITINPILAKNTYILEILHRKYEKDGFIDIKSVTAQPAISLTHLKKLKILLPPLAEQEKIAEILSCWDEGIEKLSALIEKKKIQKKALMQQLLTGKHRLKGFSTPWHEVRLEDIATITTGTSKAQYIDESGDYFVVDMGSVSNEATLIAKKRTSYDEDFLNVNDIIMPKDDIGGGNIIGKCIIVSENRKYILGDHVFKLVIKNNFPLFICLKINSFEINKYMKRCATGSAQLGLSKKDVSKCLLYIPSDLAEQKAIAEILSKADEEIELLNKKLEAFKQEKKALMQKLLTGKIRVKVN